MTYTNVGWVAISCVQTGDLNWVAALPVTNRFEVLTIPGIANPTVSSAMAENSHAGCNHHRHQWHARADAWRGLGHKWQRGGVHRHSCVRERYVWHRSLHAQRNGSATCHAYFHARLCHKQRRHECHSGHHVLDTAGCSDGS